MQKPLTTDPSLQELFTYPNNNQTLGWWTDSYDALPDKTLACHWHPAFEFDVILTGQVDYLIDGINFTAYPGDTIFINQNILHTSVGHNQATTAVFDIEDTVFPALLRSQLMTTTLPPNVIGRTFSHNSGDCEIATMLLTAYHQADDPLASLVSFYNVWQRLSVSASEDWLAAPNAKRIETTKRLLSYIASHYQHEFTLSELCTDLDISRRECFKCFADFTTASPNTYITNYRLSQALRLLQTTSTHINSVAQKSGFKNVPYFIQQFKKVYGLTPKQFQLQQKP